MAIPFFRFIKTLPFRKLNLCPPRTTIPKFSGSEQDTPPWIGLELIFVQNRNLTAETPRTQRTHFLFVPVQPEQIKSPLSRQNTDLLQSHSHQLQPKSIPKGMSFVIRSPLTIGSQRKISLCDLCAFAVNLVLKEPPIHPKGQYNQPHSAKILSNLDSNGKRGKMGAKTSRIKDFGILW